MAETARVVVAGAGIGGLAAALAFGQRGHAVQVVERSAQASEFGAGIQLGPNAWRRLAGLGLADALREQAAFPQRLLVHDARSHAVLGQLSLGEAVRQRHGEPYATVHRADLQQMLLQACQASRVGPPMAFHWGHEAERCAQDDHVVCLSGPGFAIEGELLVVADGVWSRLRTQLLDDGAPRPMGHVALRTLLDTARIDVDARELPRDAVHAWLGPRMHAVAYPVRAGRAFNLVLFVHQGERLQLPEDDSRWNGPVDAARVQAALDDAHPVLRALVAQAPQWRFWVMHGRPPVASAHELAHRRIALTGDAAHPMLPYLAQGAAMAIEDGCALAAAVQAHGGRIEPAVAHWARQRAPRVARVQRRSLRNGRIFHATGALRVARNLAMAALGETLLDLPWLYRG